MRCHKIDFAWVTMLAVLLLGVLGCSRPSGVGMAALAHIDSLLLQNDYITALQELDQINPDALNEEELAWYSLLLTQAEYKNYKPISSDSVISRAVNFYQKSKDKEKATRSLLYQGCVNEVLGNFEKAIDCYNKADETAARQDLANKAYANLRMGVLYQENIVGAKEIATAKYFEALKLYRLLGDKHYELLCLTNLGAIYRNFKEKEKQDSALLLIDAAIDLAKAQKDNYFLFENLFMKAEFYELVKQEYMVAKNYAVVAIQSGGNEIDHPRAHLCAAKSFVQLGQMDSAMYYISQSPKLSCARDSIMYFNLLADIALKQGHHGAWLKHHNRAHSMADSILIGSLNARLLAVEKKYDMQQEKLENVSLRSRLTGAWLTVALALLAALALFHLVWRYRSGLKAKEQEYDSLKCDLNTALSSLEQMQVSVNQYEHKLKSAEQDYKAELAGHEAIKFRSAEVRAIVDGQIRVVHELIKASHELDAVRFTQKFASLMTIPDNGRSASYWSHLRALTNALYNNILEDANGLADGKLLESDLNFIALCCCGYSRTAMMICLKYSNPASISNKKKKIAKKLGVPSLEGFIAPYQEAYKNSTK